MIAEKPEKVNLNPPGNERVFLYPFSTCQGCYFYGGLHAESKAEISEPRQDETRSQAVTTMAELFDEERLRVEDDDAVRAEGRAEGMLNVRLQN